MLTPSSTPTVSLSEEINEKLRMGSLLFDKCELKESRLKVEQALELARASDDVRAIVEALSVLLRLAAEALDSEKMEKLEDELDSIIQNLNEDEVPSVVWWCKGTAARYRGNLDRAYGLFLKHLKRLKTELRTGRYSNPYLTEKEALGRAWSRIAVVLFYTGKVRRSEYLASGLLERAKKGEFVKAEGYLSNLLANIYEHQKVFALSQEWYQKAMQAFLSERNWYNYLYVLLGQARLARARKEHAQALWYLDLIDKAVSIDNEFGDLKCNVLLVRESIAQDSVDLLIDSRKAVIKTREKEKVTLGKQYVLLNILEALSEAHESASHDAECGLSKSQIIEKVWKQKYRPQQHDNKLYYNINRLRKLIETDVHHPQYLQNWKEGYRLAPGLKVQWFQGNRKLKGGEKS